MEIIEDEKLFQEFFPQLLLPEETKDIEPIIYKDGKELKLVSLGKKNDIETGYKIGKFVRKFRVSVIDLRDTEDPYPMITGVALTAWQFDKYKSNKRETRIYFVTKDCEKREVKRAFVHAEAQMFARELASEPPNALNPETFPKYILDKSKGLPIDITIMEEEDLKKEGLELLLAVGKGSEKPPKLLIMNYEGGGKKVGLVGKGVTFDAGGYNLKPANYMKNMHADMSGAAAVAAATLWAARFGLKVNVTAIIPLAENLISGRAYKMEDVIRSYSGKFVHIGNTDAEGRLILADALSYIKKFRPNVTMTLATLTGAQIIALGYDIAALYSTSDEYARIVEKASSYTKELVWRMPLYEKYRSDLDHPVADLTNISSKRQAGSIIGALFLKEFAPEPWIYLDIAGPAMAHEANVRWASSYPTGWGTRLSLRVLELIGGEG